MQAGLVALQVRDARGLAGVLDLDQPGELGGDLGAGAPGGTGDGQDERGGSGGQQEGFVAAVPGRRGVCGAVATAVPRVPGFRDSRRAS
ncbi:hypothetical protein LUX33_40945 [Actinomadura madurae]|uniref:hypothetical protein n=1 Tax=Actinomadura madurae TaxID=1993 RepID=UPI0020D20D38|nr:hypothetical protein [Actinomadura madurae]MCP9954159.1 hypothetical protein [Actinomadura madurae]